MFSLKPKHYCGCISLKAGSYIIAIVDYCISSSIFYEVIDGSMNLGLYGYIFCIVGCAICIFALYGLKSKRSSYVKILVIVQALLPIIMASLYVTFLLQEWCQITEESFNAKWQQDTFFMWWKYCICLPIIYPILIQIATHHAAVLHAYYCRLREREKTANNARQNPFKIPVQENYCESISQIRIIYGRVE